MSETVSITQFLATAIRKNICSYAFANPGTTAINIGVELVENPQDYTHLNQLEGKTGFVFAPFDTESNNKSYFIKQEIATVSTENYQKILTFPDKEAFIEEAVVESSYNDYQQQITKMLMALKNGELDKVILSRIKFVPNGGRAAAVEVFLRMCKAYPDAFVFMVNIPNVGLWLGASPEQLANYDGKYLKTVALAGTQPLENRAIEQITWQRKEQEEQALVIQYIDQLFADCKPQNLQRSEPFTVRAGGVVHLKTTYCAAINSWQQAVDFVTNLHPTPAVCGLPKIEAKQLIKNVEKHNRTYYAGYLGELKSTGTFSLFVNLRSMQVLTNGMALFVGGGITAQSDKQKEWNETCHKAETLLKMINNQ